MARSYFFLWSNLHLFTFPPDDPVNVSEKKHHKAHFDLCKIAQKADLPKYKVERTRKEGRGAYLVIGLITSTEKCDLGFNDKLEYVRAWCRGVQRQHSHTCVRLIEQG